MVDAFGYPTVNYAVGLLIVHVHCNNGSVKDICIGLYHIVRLTRVYTQPRVTPLYYELLIYIQG